MARSTFKVLFYLKRQSEKNGKVPVMGRITVNGTISQFSCKLNIRPSLWDLKANKASGKSLESQRINEKLENIKTNIGKQYQRICDRDAYVTAEKVKNAYLGFGDEYRLLMQSFDEYLTDFERQRVGKDRTAGTLGQYRYSRDKVAAFLEYKYHVSDIAFKELTPDFIKEYYIYLRTVCNLRQGTIHKILKKLKLMTYTAHKNGWISANPFCDFKIAPEYGDRHFLTEEELQRVINVHLPHYKSRIIRDIFVFCCFTGLSYADVRKLTFDDIRTTDDGEQWIIDHRQKTGTQFRIKLLPVAKALVAKYRLMQLPENKVFPVREITTMNISLRQLRKHGGLSFSPTMHVRRHSTSLF